MMALTATTLPVGYGDPVEVAPTSAAQKASRLDTPRRVPNGRVIFSH